MSYTEYLEQEKAKRLAEYEKEAKGYPQPDNGETGERVRAYYQRHGYC